MFALQLSGSALVWGVLITWLVRSRDALIARSAALPRGHRTRRAIVGLLVSFVVLAFGMGVLPHGGLTGTALSWWGWPLVTLVGAAFVALQSLALVPLVLNAIEPVTRDPDRSSDTIDVERP